MRCAPSPPDPAHAHGATPRRVRARAPIRPTLTFLLPPGFAGTDLHILKGDVATCAAGRILGHEGVGFIEKIHPSAEGKGFKVGDAIGFNYFLGVCFECDGCMVHNLRCERQPSLLQGFAVDGFFQEYSVVDYHNAVHLPKELDMKRTAPLFCAGITGMSLGLLEREETCS